MRKSGKKLFLATFMTLSGVLLTGCHLKHDWVEATCTEPKTCTVCDKTKGEPLGHTWEEATCTEPKTCCACGKTKGEALGHTWTEATCTEAKTCSVCGQTEGKALGHTWQKATCTTPKTCSVCGGTEGEAAGHDWTEATCTTPKTCKRCNATEGEATGVHTWQEATCTAPKTCRTCGATEGELAGHVFDENGTCLVCHLRKMELTWENVEDYLDVSCSTRSDGANYRITVTVTPKSDRYTFQDAQIHIGLNLQRSVGGQIELLGDAPLDFNFDDREHFYDLGSDGRLTVEGHFPKEYELDYRPLLLWPRGYCIGD